MPASRGRAGHGSPPRGVAVLGSGAAVAGPLGLAWLNLGATGGSLTRTAARAVHPVAVGAWVGGAVWHNAVGVPAHATPGDTGTPGCLRDDVTIELARPRDRPDDEFIGSVDTLSGLVETTI